MKTAVISGGNGGLGRALGKGLQERGWRTFLVDLDITGLEESTQQIPIQCDLTDPAQLEGAVTQLLSTTSSVDLVIYNAGITHIGAARGLTEAALRKVFEINVFAAINMALALQEPVRKAQGTHLAMSSVAGFAPLFHRTAYAASKHALQGFFGSLRSEERPFGVKTLIAAPSFVATNVGQEGRDQDGTGRPGGSSDGIDFITPEAATEIILRGVERQQDFIPVGRVSWLSYVIHRLSPQLYQRLMERKIQGR